MCARVSMRVRAPPRESGPEQLSGGPRGTHRQPQEQCRREAASRWSSASPPPGRAVLCRPGCPASAGRWHPGPLPAFTLGRPSPCPGCQAARSPAVYSQPQLTPIEPWVRCCGAAM